MLSTILTSLFGQLLKMDVRRNNEGYYLIHFYFESSPSKPKFSVTVTSLREVIRSVSSVPDELVPEWLKTVIQVLKVIRTCPWMSPSIRLVMILYTDSSIVEDITSLIKEEIPNYYIRATKEGNSWKIEVGSAMETDWENR